MTMYDSAAVSYTMDVIQVPVSEARARLPELIEHARDEAVSITRHGKPQAVLVSSTRYQQLLDAYDEQLDIDAFDAALAEEGDSVPWEQVKSDLGWT